MSVSSGGTPLLLGTVLQAVEIGDGLLCLGGGGEDRPGVRLHDAQPVVKVASVIGVRLGGDADTRTKESCAGLGYLS